ncbi:hypothetical protein HOY80DRAFT_1093559, partial [Tuber brumale]
MFKFRKKLREWMVANPGDNPDSRGGGRKFSQLELLTTGFEFICEQWNSFSSLRKPGWCTGWRTGVLACTASVVVVLFINVSLTIYAATNSEYPIEGGFGTLYFGSCDKSRAIDMWLHLGINAVSTLLLSGSNYTQQCLAAPTRSEIDAAHERRRWMDIGVPSVRNLFRIKRERTLLWIAIGVTSIPLHLLYNSVVYHLGATDEFFVAVVTNNHFEQASYSNMTEKLLIYYEDFKNLTGLAQHATGSEVRLFGLVLERYDTGNQNYEDLTPSECIKHYNTDIVSNRRNLFVIAKDSPNPMHNNTFLHVTQTEYTWSVARGWICGEGLYSQSSCNYNELASNVTTGLPWRMKLATYGEVEISGCKSERIRGNCKVQFSLWIMITVICCNLITACSMAMVVARSREPTLVTLGDAVDSFLRIPDPTTIGICFADRRFIEREWRHGWWSGTRQWGHTGVQRWWTSVSKTRWITCNIFCLITIIIAGVLTRMGIINDGNFWSNDLKSIIDFDNVITNPLQIVWPDVAQSILLANFPQIILSFLYLTYNSLFTCMLSAYEWSLFSHHHCTLHVTSPRPGQRSTYWLQIPYTYGVPLMTLSGLLHWLTSQSIFLVRVRLWSPLGEESYQLETTLGYSCIIIFVLTLGILALLTAAGMGYKQFSAEITTVGSSSAAISAACHSWEDKEQIVGRKVRWGDMGIVQDLGVRHLTFSSKEAVGKPVFGGVYAGR